MHDLAGRTALVTGASHGLGPYIARALAAKRMKLVLAARSAAELDALAGELRKSGREALPVPADLAQAVDRERLVTAAHNQFGAVDVLVNNAGVFFPKSFHRSSARELEHTVEVNLVAPLVLSALVLPGMLERARGAHREPGIARRQDSPKLHRILRSHEGRAHRALGRAPRLLSQQGGECVGDHTWIRHGGRHVSRATRRHAALRTALARHVAARRRRTRRGARDRAGSPRSDREPGSHAAD